MTKLFEHITESSILMNDGRRGYRKVDYIDKKITWRITKNSHRIEEEYQCDYNAEYNGWWSITYPKNDKQFSKCNIPECEKEYQKLLREEKLERISK